MRGPVRAIWHPWLLQHIGGGIQSDLRGKQLLLLNGIHRDRENWVTAGRS